jgi:glutamate carboxypeptidase
MRQTAAAMLLALGLAAPAAAAPAQKAMPRDAKVWNAAERLRADQLKLLEAVVSIDSGTSDVAGGDRVRAIFAERLAVLGFKVEPVPAEAPGLPANLVATLEGTGKGRILMIGHLDTVFETGTVARWPFRVDGDRATGPGVGDEKGGVVEGIMALTLLRDLGFRDFGRITLLVESSEERGSPGTRALIARLLKDADVELNLEPGDPPDTLTVWRKGSNAYTIKVRGRAAHAGVAPQDGRNAATELIHQLKVLERFPRSGEGLTANLTLMSAGARNNIIPEDAQATINVRNRAKGDLDALDRAFAESARTTEVPDTTVTAQHEVTYPPLSDNPGTDALADRAAAIYAGLGLTIGRGGNGGASESALAYEAGVPALDGLGPVGGGFHSEREYIDLKTVTPRLYLLTKLLMELGKQPPPPLK